MEKQATKEGLQAIIQAIENIITPQLSTLKYDKTYRAKVSQKLSENRYIIQINGAGYQITYDGFLNIGDVIKVKAPLNNFSDIYIEPSSSLKVEQLIEFNTGKEATVIVPTLNKYSLLVLQCISKDNSGILASTIFTYDELKQYKKIEAIYAGEPQQYDVTISYVSDTQLNVKCIGTSDGLRVLGIK